MAAVGRHRRLGEHRGGGLQQLRHRQTRQVGRHLRVIVTFSDAPEHWRTSLLQPHRAWSRVPAQDIGLSNLTPLAGTVLSANLNSLLDPDGLPAPSTYQWQWQSAANNGSTDLEPTSGASSTGALPPTLTVGSTLAGLNLRLLLSYTDCAKARRDGVLRGHLAGVHRRRLHLSGSGNLVGTNGNDTLTGSAGNDTLTAAPAPTP